MAPSASRAAGGAVVRLEGTNLDFDARFGTRGDWALCRFGLLSVAATFAPPAALLCEAPPRRFPPPRPFQK